MNRDGFDDLARRALDGDKEAAQELLTLGYQNFEDKPFLLQVGHAVCGALDELSPRAKYATAGLLINAGEGQLSYKILRDLAWDDGYGPAQWRLGRMIANEEVVLEDADRNVGFDLLRAARENGHLRANQSILVARSRDRAFPVSFVFLLAASVLGLRTAILKVVFKRKDETVI